MTDDDTLTLADGTVIDAATGRIVGGDAEDDSGGTGQPPRFIEVPTSLDAVAEVTRIRRRVADLPMPPKR